MNWHRVGLTAACVVNFTFAAAWAWYQGFCYQSAILGLAALGCGLWASREKSIAAI